MSSVVWPNLSPKTQKAGGCRCGRNANLPSGGAKGNAGRVSQRAKCHPWDRTWHGKTFPPRKRCLAWFESRSRVERRPETDTLSVV
eukprot:6212397-Pleurochrysis_carterae.AAC.2